MSPRTPVDTDLSPAGFKILTVLRRRLRPGVRHRVSQVEIAQWANVSEGTVNTVLRKQLDGQYLRRDLVLVGAKRHAEIELFPFNDAPKGRRTAPDAHPPASTPVALLQEDLRRLRQMRAEGLISPAEHDELRAAAVARYASPTPVPEP